MEILFPAFSCLSMFVSLSFQVEAQAEAEVEVQRTVLIDGGGGAAVGEVIA